MAVVLDISKYRVYYLNCKNVMTDAAKVSLSELLEVRGAGLEVEELLDITLVASEYLVKKRPLPNCKAQLFGVDEVNILKDGNIEICFIPANQAEDDIIPPEIKDPNNPGKVVGSNTDAAFVWCLGTLLMNSGAADCKDPNLFSLLNLLTVYDVGTRPSLKKLAQMVRNKMERGRNSKQNIQELYAEIMGDYDELNEMSSVDDISERDLFSDEEEINDRDDDNESGSHLFDYTEDIINNKNNNTKVVKNINKNTNEKIVTPNSPFNDNFFESRNSPKPNIKDLKLNGLQENTIDPFDYVDKDKQNEHNMHTLSGRDPFHDAEKDLSQSFNTNNNKKMSPITSTSYGFSRCLSDDDDIVQANVPYETPSPVSSPLSTTDDLGYESPKSNIELQNKNKLNTNTINSLNFSHGRSDFSSDSNEFNNQNNIKNEVKNNIKKEFDYDTPPIAPQRTSIPLKISNPFVDNNNIDEKENDNTTKFMDTNNIFKSSLEIPPVSARTRSIDYYKSQHVNAEVVVKQQPDIISSNPFENEKMISGTITSKNLPKFINEDNTKINEEESIDDMFLKARQQQNSSSLTGEKIDDNEEIDVVGTLKRRNSMALASIRKHNQKFTSMGYGSMRKKLNKTAAVPEFIEKNSLPHIHLNAQLVKKKRLLTLYRVENTDVRVKLLNGQYIDVKCKSDIKCDEIFNLVVSHCNIHEYHFFGLAIQKDNEFYFLDPKKKIEKYAPSGWKNEKKAMTRQPYILHMRFMRYPPLLSYVKTDITMHELYLQLRNDILNERLRGNETIIFQLASLALQAEFSNKPDSSISSPTDYFLLDHYLPKQYFAYDDSKRIALMLSEMHEKLKGMKCHEAEIRYIKICQTLPEYGSHFYRIFKSKPTQDMIANMPTRSVDAGSIHLIAIMLKGICIYEFSNNQRNMIQEFLWKDTNTLQFDRKRFVIVKSNTFGAQHFVFYTDHYTKSSYFVRFAAVQHKFMIRVRQWQSTLKKKTEEKPGENGIDVSIPKEDDIIEKSLSNNQIIKQEDTLSIKNKNSSLPLYEIPENQPINDNFNNNSNKLSEKLYNNRDIPTKINQNNEEKNSIKYNLITPQIKNHTIDDEKISRKSSENYSDYPLEQKGQELSITLEKDPKAGLGLTLVDGKWNGVKGIFVKAVTLGGAGEIGGVCVGDKLISVNGISLLGKDRHDAVTYVKESNASVTLGIIRYDNLATRHGKGITTLGRPQRKDSNLDSLSLSSNVLKNTSYISNDPNISSISKDGTTPPTKKKHTNAPIIQKRVRAVSDFGAKSDKLPMFNTEDIINELQKNTKNPSRLDLHMDSSDEEFGAGEYQVPATSMYKYHDSDNDDDDDNENLDKFNINNANQGYGLYNKYKKSNHTDNDQFDNKSWSSNNIPKVAVRSLDHPSTNNDINDEGEYKNNYDNGIQSSYQEENKNENIKEMIIYIKRSPNGSLGLKIATGIEGAYIKQINAEPALSSGIMPNDKLISINNIYVHGMTHSDIIGLLRDGGENVAIKILRDLTETGEEEIITVYLTKKDTISLGLSLSKKTDSEGSFIRHIAEGSVAYLEKSLKIGDRIWEVNDIFVGNEGPNNVGELLKTSNNDLKITIKRKVGHSSNINNF
uniref:FERM and PDZ domain-containing protein 2 n=1 Tax=Strongyloides stercoralis TaxID=6248 RepID=A0A0K0EGX9_STRER